MRLFHFSESSASFRVRAALILKGIEFESTIVNIRSQAHHIEPYISVNPQKLVPFLLIKDGFGLGQSLSIIEYLEQFKGTPSLFPSSLEDRWTAHSIACQIACDTSPFQKTTLQEHFISDYSLDAPDIAKWLEHWVLRGLEPVEKLCKQRLKTHHFLFGDTPTIAECFIVPQLHNMKKFGISTQSLVHLKTLEQRCLEHSAFDQAHPSRWHARNDQ